MNLAGIDVAVVALYLLGTLALGAWFARRQSGINTYFVGDRNLPWWLVLGSIVATETSTVTFLSVPGLAYAGNMTFLQLALGYVLGRLVIAWLLVPQYFRGEVLTAYQVLRQRFDVSVQRAASGLFLVTRTVADGLRLFLTALLLHLFTGWDAATSIVVLGIITITYTYLGGMQAVVWTDLIQLVVYLLGAGAAGLVMLNLAPGGWSGLIDVAAPAGKFTWIDITFDPQVAYNLWAGVIGGAFFTMASHGADQLMVQRYLCSRGVGEARLALGLSGVAVFAQFALFLLLGVGLFALKQAGAFPVPVGTRNDEVFGLFIVQFLPHGVVGLVVAAVMAAAMSTLSSSLNSSSGALVVDFYRPLSPTRSEAHYLAVSKVMTAVFGVAQIAVALGTLWAQSERSIVDQVLTVAGLTTGLVLGLFALGSLSRPVASRSALIGAAVGLAAVLAVWAPVWGDEGDASLLAWPWFAPVGTLTTVTVALVVDRVTRSDEAPPQQHGGSEKTRPEG